VGIANETPEGLPGRTCNSSQAGIFEMNELKHESKCKRCGRCCMCKIAVWDRSKARVAAELTGAVCRFQDPVSKLCTVYDYRKKVKPTCLSIPEAIRQKMLPNDCPYVKGKFKYRTMVRNYPKAK